MDIRELKPFDKVIIHDDSEWNGLIGIVSFNEKGIVGLITPKNPQHHYLVGIWNADNIEPFN